MGDELSINGVSVETEQLDERAALMHELAREAAALRARLGSIDALVGWFRLWVTGAPLAAGKAEAAIDVAILLLAQLEAAANALQWMLASAADAYTFAERFAGQLGRGVAGGIGAIAGKVLPVMLLSSPAALGGVGGLVAASRATPGGLGGAIDRAMGSSGVPQAGEFIRQHNEWLNNPLTADLVRNGTHALGTATMSSMMPAELAAALGGTGVGTGLAAAGVMRAGGTLGMFTETPVRMVDRTASPADAAPTGFAERFARIPDADVTDGAQVIIERYETPGRPDRFEVYVAGTVTFSPGATDEPWDMTSNLANAAGFGSGSYAAVREAMLDAGITPESPVQFTGYSQGGGTAARLAASGEWNTQGVASFGGPTGGIPLPSDVPAVIVEHREDLVPALGGPQLNRDAVLVQREVFAGVEVPDHVAVPAHHAEYYAQTAALMDAEADPQLGDAGARLDSFGAGASTVTSTAYRFERVDPGLSGSVRDRSAAAG